MSESFGSSLPVNKGSIEGTSRATISQANEMITQSSVFTVVRGGQVSSSPSNSFSASSGVLKASRAVTSIRGGRDVSTGGIASSSRDKSTTDVSSGRNMVPDGSSAGRTADIVTVSLAINVDFSIGAKRADNTSTSVGTATDIEGFRSFSANSGRTAACWGALAVVANPSTANVSSSRRNMVPDVGCTSEARGGFSIDLTINVNLGTSAK